MLLLVSGASHGCGTPGHRLYPNPLVHLYDQLQVSCADPRPFIMFENKRFPHFRQVDLLDVERFLPFFPWGKLLFQ